MMLIPRAFLGRLLAMEMELETDATTCWLAHKYVVHVCNSSRYLRCCFAVGRSDDDESSAGCGFTKQGGGGWTRVPTPANLNVHCQSCVTSEGPCWVEPTPACARRP